MDGFLSPAEWQAVRLSLRVAFAATLGLLPIAFGLAYLLARRRFWGKALVDGLVHLPLVLPPVVTGYLLLLAFGRNGPLGQLLEALGTPIAFRWTGAAVAAAIMALPLMVRAIRLSLEAVDPRLEMAGRSLGGSPLHVFATVTLPLCLPGLIAGGILTFAKCMGEFGATITFVSSIPGETQTLPLAIYGLLQVPGAESQVLRLSLIAALLSMAALVVSEWLTRRATARHLL